jgi:cytosine/adenosine deaminase-related metal-dependent hydrolase
MHCIAIALAASLGTTHIRTHVDVDTEVGVAGIEGVLETRERYRDAVHIELVAFPQSGMLIRPGTVELMDTALRLGAQVVGGLDPAAIDRDPKGHLDVVFGLADRYGVPVDIHLHETAELGAFSLELIIERTKALGLQGKVTVSHAFCLGMTDQDYVAALIDELAEAHIHILTTAPAFKPAPAVKRLVEASIVVAAGSDGVRDTWGPYNTPDMLERAVLVGPLRLRPGAWQQRGPGSARGRDPGRGGSEPPPTPAGAEGWQGHYPRRRSNHHGDLNRRRSQQDYRTIKMAAFEHYVPPERAGDVGGI